MANHEISDDLKLMGYCERHDCKHYFETLCLAGDVPKTFGDDLWHYKDFDSPPDEDYSNHKCVSYIEGVNEGYNDDLEGGE